MSISDIDQETRPRFSRRRGLYATAVILGLVLIGIGAPHSGAQAELVAPLSQAERSQGPTLAPSAEVTSSIGTLASPKTPPQPARTSTIPTRERITLIILLALCFGVMAIGGFRLWRRSVDELIRARSGAPGGIRDRD